MTGSVALDIVISLVFIYLLYSLLATILQEILAAQIIRLRAGMLKKALTRMLDDDTGTALLSKQFFKAPLIKYLQEQADKFPSYLSSKNFSEVVIDILRGESPKPGEDFRSKINSTLNGDIALKGESLDDTKKLSDGETFQYLRSLWATSQGDIEKFKLGLEQWFDDTMERLSGWYKKKTQILLMAVGLLLAVIFNVDTIVIVSKLSSNPTLTAQVVQQAANFLKAHPDLKRELEEQQNEIDKLIKTDSTKLKEKASLEKAATDANKALKEQQELLIAEANELNSLLGMGIQNYEWRGDDFLCRVGYFLLSVLGWCITALAISLGAPFWFDLLNKLMKLRTSIAPAPAEDTGAKKKADDKKQINPKG
ncbi:hypothetical protein SAMN04488109_0321 [Chryseolinea serpens]|uniref:Uncharacterized protein n=1 Tax=Chryseolinea serpens TaxID=947013 RepID=A0A1M5JWG3_9BACT|nr:hypothetical protein [Chryseolinea serpens]SHG44876.1 hypothetical protein SAMN04488109_0321 [Chryseolinea serpens]